MLCKRCGLKVEPIKLEQGILNNVYKCPKCGREFGGSTLLKKGGQVALWLATLGLVMEPEDLDLFS